MGLTDVELLWTCHWCGLDTPHPSEHVQVHGITIDQLMEHLERTEKARRALERLLLLQGEMGTRAACPCCGRPFREARGE